MNVLDILEISPVIPVVTLPDVATAVPLARSLLDGGIAVIEVTLRTNAGLQGIARIRDEVPEICVGAGTVWTAADLRTVVDAGAQFGVSPGGTAALLDAVASTELPFLPGAQTPSEVADRAARGFSAVKFFPAAPSGGVPALKALCDVFPDLRFCPTGGVTAQDAGDYRALPQVPTVGGSWITPRALVESGDWPRITELARAAVSGP